MSAETYQALRGHLAHLRLIAAAEALAPELDYARDNKLTHTAFLERLLAIEVKASRPGAGAAGALCQTARPLAVGGLRLRRPADPGPKAHRRLGHATVLGRRHQHLADRAARGGQDDVGRLPGPFGRRVRLPLLLYHRG